MAGYALECALKACIFKVYVDSELIFKEKKMMGKVNNEYWTHNLEALFRLADLTKEFGIACGDNKKLETNWSTVKDWSVDDRYEQKSETVAREMIEAISNTTDGVLPWLQARW